MTTAITFSRQNDAGSRVSNTQYWENLVLVVVLVLESKLGLYYPGPTTRSDHVTQVAEAARNNEA